MSKSWMAAAGLVALTALGMVGCGLGGPKTFPVKGQVQLPGADINVLAGHSLQIIKENDPLVQAYAEIKPDGSFALETYDKGAFREGAFEGKYKARIVLSDDNLEARNRAAQIVPSPYLQFDTSDLKLEVPAKGDVTLPLVRR